jgi:signal transduction histidine kinase
VARGGSAAAPSRTGRLILGSVRNRLAALFFVITAAAIGFVYLYVVPQLRSSLTAEKLQRLEQLGTEESNRLASAARRGESEAGIYRLVRGVAERTDARVTLFRVRSGPSGPRPKLVVADSELDPRAILPSDPAATAAAVSGEVSSGAQTIAGARTGETAVPLSVGGQTRWVAVLSTPLADVDDAVALIRRQILIAGAIALVAALAAGWMAARAHAKRLGRLEAAAQQVAEGDFSTPIPDEGTDEVGQLATTLNEMQQRLARLDSARAEFIANASHELRTPIFSLGGFVELLDEEEPDPAAREEFVRTMREQVARLTKLTADLLDLSKLDSDAIEFTAERVDLSEVARRVAEEFGPASNRHQSSIEVRGATGAVAMADADRVAQIMRILVDNALTHTPEGTSIAITAQRQDGTATLVVRDDGPGIGAHEPARVFDRFYTGDRVSGSGLGLAIAQELTHRMDGELGLASRQGRTEFTLRLPAARRDEVRT